MLRGCFVDVLRLTLGAMALVCVALLITTWWLGADHTTSWMVMVDPCVRLYVNVWGPSPDLHVVLWRHELAAGISARLGEVRLPAQPLAVATIVLCLIVAGLDRPRPYRPKGTSR